MKSYKEWKQTNEIAITDRSALSHSMLQKGGKAIADKAQDTLKTGMDCAKNPKVCAMKGGKFVKGMHQELGGGVAGAAALAGIGATAAIVPGGGIASPLLYKGAKKLLGKKKIKKENAMNFYELNKKMTQ